MPTKKPRLNVVLEPKLYEVLSNIAQREKVSLSLLARDLIKESLEVYEDVYWEEISQERDKAFSYKTALSHQEIWR